jgi:hypothetical protein
MKKKKTCGLALQDRKNVECCFASSSSSSCFVFFFLGLLFLLWSSADELRPRARKLYTDRREEEYKKQASYIRIFLPSLMSFGREMSFLFFFLICFVS